MKSTRFKKLILLVVSLLSCAGMLHAQQLAFPTAEGYGKYTVGGRGGAVYEVTNLNSSGPGSFAAAIGASGPRTVVFRVSGTITGNFSIKNDNITIAGQTAPGDGICIKGNLSTGADNIIIRYIRVRWDPAMGEKDAIGGRYQKNIIFDHVSASWSTDETMTLYHNENTTVQWCIIAQACPKGTSDAHRFGGIWGNNYGTWHHNLIAHNASRNPRWASGCGYNDYRNNVIYNWQYENCYGGEAQQVGNPDFYFSTINMIANYYKAGPATESSVRYQIAAPSARSSSDKGSWYVSGNYVDGSPDVTSDNWQGMAGSNYIKLSSPWDAMAINQESPQDAYNSVLDNAGCSLPTRDRVDTDIIDDVLHGTAKYGDHGIIDSPSDVGGWPMLNSTTAPADSDHDGMPDSWEDDNGLNKNDPEDRNNIGPDGYTMLEIYLNSLTLLDNVVIHVDDDAPNDPCHYNSDIGDPLEDGTMEHPFDAIQEAIEIADEGWTVKVKEGTYWETIDFLGKNIKVNGYNPTTSPARAIPVIDANYAGTVVTFAQGEDSQCELSGFVLTRGSGIKAGAILCDGASPRISHCVIVGNRCYDPNQDDPSLADPNSGTIYCRNSDIIIDQCTISGNYGGPDGAAFRFMDSDTTITNSIVTSNFPEQIIVADGNEPLVRYCNVEGLWPGGIGNIDVDPIFVMEGQWIDATEPYDIWIDGDYHLQSQPGHWNPILMNWELDLFTSPCIDAGDPDAPFTMEPQPNGERINMGAYGGTNQASLTRIMNTRPR